MKILFATDGLPAALKARTLLERVADRERCTVSVLSVTHSGAPAPEHLPLVVDPIDARRKQTLELVDAAVEGLIADGFKADARTAEGDPAEEIVRVIERDWYDLTVLGAGSRSWLGNLLLGSVSTHVLHASPSSTLIVHEIGDDEKPTHIAVGADGSRGSEFAARVVIDLIDASRCDARVISVVRDAPRWASLPYPEDAEKLLAEARRNGRHIATMLQDAGIPTEATVLRGQPTEQLLEEANCRAVSLVAVGSRGLGRARHLLGSVSDQVTRLAPATLVARRLVT